MEKSIILSDIVENSGVEKTKAQQLLVHFEGLFRAAAEWEAKAKSIQITDVSQVREMKMAREGRLALKDIRVDAKKLKDRLKEGILSEGRLIDSMYNSIEAVTKPLEAYLSDQEKFAENLEKERKNKLKADREMLLAPYGVDTSFYQLADMPEDTFQTLLDSTKVAYQQKIDAQIKAEEERIAKEKAEEEERERIRKENERLKAEAEAKEKIRETRNKELRPYIVFIRDYNSLLNKPEEEYQKEFSEIKKGAEDHWEFERKEQIKKQKEEEERIAKAKKERDEAAAKLKAEQEAKAKLEAEINAKKGAEAKAEKERLDEIAKQKKEAEKLAKAPIKKQLNVWVDSFELPPFSTENETSNNIFSKFEAFKKWAKSEIDKI